MITREGNPERLTALRAKAAAFKKSFRLYCFISFMDFNTLNLFGYHERLTKSSFQINRFVDSLISDKPLGIGIEIQVFVQPGSNQTQVTERRRQVAFINICIQQMPVSCNNRLNEIAIMVAFGTIFLPLHYGEPRFST